MLLVQTIVFGICMSIAYADTGDAPSCPPLWEGTLCDVPICINGGYPTTNNYCNCPAAYYGIHCEAATQTKAPLTAFMNQPNTLNLMVYNLFSDYYGLNAYNIFINASKVHVGNFKYSPENTHIWQSNLKFTCSDSTSACDFDNQFMSSNMGYSADVFQKSEFPQYYWCYEVPMYKNIRDAIMEAKLEDTAITVLTQHPPSPSGFEELIQTALGFRIRINILFSDDQTFIRCSPEQIDSLRKLSLVTGGIFTDVPSGPNDNSANSIINTVLLTHVNYENINVYVNQSQIDFTFDTIANDFYIEVTNANITVKFCPYNRIESSEHSILQIQNVATVKCTFVLSPKQSTQSMMAKIFAAGNKVIVKTLYSFVEDYVVDTSNIMPKNQMEYFFAFRAVPYFQNLTGFDVLSASFIDHQTNTTTSLVQLEQRPNYALTTIFERISCSTTSVKSLFGIRLTLRTTNPTNYTISRYVPIHCLSSSLDDPTITTVSTTTTITSTTVPLATDPPALTTVPVTSTKIPIARAKKSYVVGYTNSVDESIYSDFILASVDRNKTKLFSDYGSVLFQAQSFKGYMNTPNYDNLVSHIYNQQVRNPKDALFASTQILEALQSIMNAKTPYTPPLQNSFISILTDVLPTDSNTNDENIASYKDFINKNNKIVFWMNSATFTQQLSIGRSPLWLNLLASVSNGHFVVSDQTSSDFQDNVGNFLSKGPAQNLLFSKNIIIDPTNGNLDLSSMSHTIYIYGTATVAIQNNVEEILQCQSLTVQFTSATYNKTASLNRIQSSNLFVVDLQLQPENYVVFFLRNPLCMRRAVNLRFWNTQSADVEVQYADYNDVNTVFPNTYYGAALRARTVGGEPSESFSVTYSDCRSIASQTSYFDAVQTVRAESDVFNAVPLLCQKRTENCVSGTERVYTMQMSTNDGQFIGSKSFYCEESIFTPTCGDQDSDGNYICNTPLAPFLRGPAGNIIDCNLHSELTYNKTMIPHYAPYSCSCSDKSTGISCEIGNCDSSNTALDTLIRTYTVIIAIGTNSPTMDCNTASEVLKVDSDTKNIWQYQLLGYCSDGTYYSIYIGKDPVEFNYALEKSRNLPSCDVSTFNISDIYRVGTLSVGKEQNGVLVIFYASEIFLDNFTVDTDQFSSIAQQYRQRLFIYNAVVNEEVQKLDVSSKQDLIQATLSTGGTTILDDIIFFDDANTQFFAKLVKSSPSMNYINFGKSIENIAVYAESEAYVIVGGGNSQFEAESASDSYNIFTKIVHYEGAADVSVKFKTEASWGSVFVLNGASTPYAVLKGKDSSDSWAAYSVNQAESRTVLGLQIPKPYTFETSLTDFSRSVSRGESCSYNIILYKPMAPLPVGYSKLEITLTSPDGKYVNKAFPIITSTEVDCKNDVRDQKNGACVCSNSQFTGPDCSEPLCGVHGYRSVMGEACNCDDIGGGRFCSSQANNAFFAYI